MASFTPSRLNTPAMIRSIPLLTVVLLLFVCRSALAQTRPTTRPTTDRASLERQFEKTMSGATLVGHFSVDGEESSAKEERYTISKVTKGEGDEWTFYARMQFGKADLTLPVMLPVKWAGDTPVITVDQVRIPGMGTYSARVMIDGTRYAGTWSGSPTHGGQMWGRIVREDATTKQTQNAERRIWR